VAGLGLGAIGARAEPKTPVCLDTSTPSTDIEIRGVTLQVSADRKWVGATACVVSRRNKLREVGVAFAAFDNHGRFLGTNGQFLGDIPNPTTKPENVEGPIIILPAGASFQIALIDLDHDFVDDLILVSVKWRPCEEIGGSDPKWDDCKLGVARTDTFLAKATKIP
jgi:hypothetical protein